MSLTVVIGTWMLLGVMAVGFMAIFLAVISRDKKKPKKKRSR